MAEIVSLAEAVERTIHDGDAVAMEGFTHLIPFAAGHEVIRQRRRDLTLIRMTPDLIYDQLIGAGCARKLIFSWGGNPGVGSLHRFRDAVEHAWPAALEIEEHSHAGMANRYVAGAAGLPFAVLRGYNGTDLYRLETLNGGHVAVGHPRVAVLLYLQRDRPGMLHRVAEPVQRADARIAAPGEDQLAGAACADELVVDQVGRHPDQGQIPAPLPDHLVSGGERDQVRESLHGHGVPVVNRPLHGFGE